MSRARRIYNLYEAKTELSSLVERAAAGEDIIIAKAGVPKARLVRIASVETRREPGGWEGRARIADDFDDPLPESLQHAFNGRDHEGE